MQDPEMRLMYFDTCTDDTWVQWGNKQYRWIAQTLKEWETDTNIIWKASVQHYPLWTLWYAQSDFTKISQNFLPLLIEYKFDLYLNGHEHLLAYAYIESSTSSLSQRQTELT